MAEDLDTFIAGLEEPAEMPQEQKDPLVDFFNGGVDPDAKFDLSMKEGLKRNEGTASRVLKMQMKTGLPEDLIERNLENVEVEATKNDFNPKAFRESSDIVANWYAENPNHPAVAYKDISKLSYIERLFKHVSNRKSRGELKREMVDLGEASFLERISGDQKKRLEEIKKTLEKEETFGIEGFFETFPGDVADQYPNYRDIFTQGLKGGAIGVTGGAATGGALTALTGGAAAPSVPFLAGKGALAGFVAGGILETARSEGAHAFVEYEDLKDENGVKMDRNVAKGAALAVGAINGSLEFFSFGGLLKTVPGVNKLKSKFGRTAVKKALQSPSVRRALATYFGRIGKTAGTEGVTEFLQEMTTSVAGDLAVMAQDGRLENASTGELLEELFTDEKVAGFKQAGILGAKVGGGITVATQSVQAKLDFNEIKKAASAREAIINLGEGVKDTELIGKVPGKMEEVVARTVEGTPAENINIPVNEWATYWQSKQINPEEMYKEVAGESENYSQALRSGEDLSIPTKRYAATLAPTEHNDALADHIRFDENEMTASEAQNVVKRFNEAAQQEEQAEVVERTVSGQEIEDNVSGQLRDLGFDDNASTNYAQLHRSFFETMASKTGQKPAELFNKYNLKIASKLEDDTGKVLFQGERGKVQFKPDAVNIELLRNADLSTFLHETGHFFLEAMGDMATVKDAPSQVFEDYKTILDYVGVKERSEIKVEHHEKFAEAFERYLAEGKAPSSKLKQAFNTFKEFIVSAYRKMTSVPGAELTDEVRRVMDRLLATDEEIANVETKYNKVPLFEDLRTLGFSKEEAARYQNTLKEVHEEAKEEVTSKLMNDVNKTKDARYKKVRSEVKQEVTDEVNERKEYVAQSVLTTGKLPSGEAFPQDIKLSKKAILDLYGKESLPKMRPFIYRVKGGVSPDYAASILGYSSGDELLKAMVDIPSKSKVISEEVDKRMQEIFPDEHQLSNLGELVGEVVESKKRGEVLMKELEILVKTDFTKFKNVTKKLTRRLPKQKDIAEDAKASIESKRYRNIKPIIYQRAQSKASRESVELLFKGNLNGAYEAKLRELYNHELYREAIKARQQVDKITKHMQKFSSKGVRQKLGKAGGTYLEQIDGILDRFDFRRTVSLKEVDKRQSLLKWYMEQRDAGNDIHIDDFLLQQAVKTHYKDMNLEKLNAIYDTVRNIEHLAGTKLKLMQKRKTRDFIKVKDEIIASIEANNEVRKQKEDTPKTFTEKFIKGVKVFAAEHTKMEFFAQALDGNKFSGAVWRWIYQPFAISEDVKTKRTRDSVQKLNEIYSVYTKEERAKWVLKKTYMPSLDISLTKANIIALALNQGNQYNKDAVLEGKGWTQGQVDQALETLDERDWKVVQAIWDHIDSFWPEVEAMEKNLNGVAPAKVEATPVETKYGTLAGGYYPIVFDSELSDSQRRLDVAQDVKDVFGGDFARAMTRKGHTVERNNTGGKPILLTLSGLSDHLRNVIHDLSYREAVIDVHKIINNKEIKESIVGAAGKEMYDQLNPWLVSIATDRLAPPSSKLESLMGTAKDNATKVSMGIKLSTAYVQLLGLTVSMKEAGIKDITAGTVKFTRNPYKVRDFIFERSEFMISRMDNFDRDVRELLSRMNITGEDVGSLAYLKAYTSDYQISLFKHIAIMDMAVAMPTWLTAYEQAMDGQAQEKGVEKGNEKDAVAYADSIVRITQGSGAAKDLAKIQRGGKFQKMFTMFYSFFSVAFNQFLKTHQEFARDKDVGAAVRSLALLWFIPVALESLMKGEIPDDPEKAKRFLTLKMVTYPFQAVVFLRDVINGMDKYGYSPSAAFDGAEAFGRTGRSIIELAAGEKEEIKRTDIKNALLTTGYLTGLPSRQIWLTSEYFYDWLTNEDVPDNIFEGLGRGLVTGKKRN